MTSTFLNIEERNQLVIQNIALATFVAKRFIDRGIEYEDLLNEARLFLIEAIERYNPNKGKLSTYVVNYIVGKIKTLINNANKCMGISREKNEKYHKYKINIALLTQKLAHIPSNEEIAHYLKISIEEVFEMEYIDYMLGMVSLNQSGNEDGDLTIIDLVEDPESKLEILRIFDYETVEVLRKILTPKQFHIIYSIFYLGIEVKKIAEFYSTTSGVVNMQKNRALKILAQHPIIQEMAERHISTPLKKSNQRKRAKEPLTTS